MSLIVAFYFSRCRLLFLDMNIITHEFYCTVGIFLKVKQPADTLFPSCKSVCKPRRGELENSHILFTHGGNHVAPQQKSVKTLAIFVY